MQSKVLAAFVAAGLVAVACGSAHASSVGVFFAPDGSDCDGTAETLTPFFTYFGAVLGADTAQDGILGAEFRVDGYDPTWFNVVTPSPSATLVLGNPITLGCEIMFPSCLAGTNSFVLMYSVQTIAFSAPGDRILRVTRHQTPANPNFQCPLVYLCDAPVFSMLCVSRGQGFLNHSAPCTVGVERKSWSQVKSMFH